MKSNFMDYYQTALAKEIVAQPLTSVNCFAGEPSALAKKALLSAICTKGF